MTQKNQNQNLVGFFWFCSHAFTPGPDQIILVLVQLLPTVHAPTKSHTHFFAGDPVMADHPMGEPEMELAFVAVLVGVVALLAVQLQQQGPLGRRQVRAA